MNANLQTAFCQTCNARDRVIQHGRCVVCHNEPQMPGDAYQQAWTDAYWTARGEGKTTTQASFYADLATAHLLDR